MTKYINREISWLRFNARVLQEAQDPSNPLLERLRFLGIYSNNLDEFFKVRYATLVRAIQVKSKYFNNIIEHQTPEELLEEINQEVAKQQIIYNNLYEEIIHSLEKENIIFVDENRLLPEHKAYVEEYFETKLSHSIVVMNWNQKAYTGLRDGAFYLVVKMSFKKRKNEYAIIDVPVDLFGRFVVLPKLGERNYVMFIEDIVRYHLKEIFGIFKFSEIEAHAIKITRDAELSLDNDVEMSFLQSVSEGVQDRKKGEPVRLVYDSSMATDTLEFIKKPLSIDVYDSIIPGGRYQNKRDFMSFPNFGRKDLEYPKIKPIVPPKLSKNANFFRVFSQENHLLYVPYHDFSIFLKFLRKAAIDPKVKKIAITIYRVAKNSQVMSALINAAKNGKSVTAILELQARFDEENNIQWSRILQEAGVRVIFGVAGLKVHSKIGYIEREPERGCKEKYAFIGTGNFHEGTARIYTDFFLFTTDEATVNDVQDVFDFFEKNYLLKTYSEIILSPWQTRGTLLKLIQQEIKNHKKGLPAQINIKVNSLSDKQLIDALYEASQAGVEVRLLVRGICSLIPRNPDFSKNIKAVSVVDKFLEHPRVFWFKNGGDDKIFISSSDIMGRNLDHRIEVTAPIKSAKNKRIVMKIFELGMSDNVKGRLLNPQGYVGEIYQKSRGKKIRSQEEIYHYLTKLK